MAVDSMQRYLDRRYDSFTAWCMYKAKFPAEDVMLFAAPLIQILCNTRFRRVFPEQLEDAKSEAFYDLMVNIGLPPSGQKSSDCPERRRS